jgi:DNA repair photolyase
VYCFSRKRSKVWASKGVHAASATAFGQRLRRIREGHLASALDEFLAARVPIQLGGLHDPFTPRERVQGVTLQLLKILQDFDYPTLISTKGELIVESDYVSLLKEMDVLVRFSAAGVSERFRGEIDRRCATFDRTLDKISILTSHGIATGLRIQPVIPGFEDDAIEMARQASAAGVRQISFEYLKLPTESLQQDTRRLHAVLGFDVFDRMRQLGVTAVGWDYTLSPKAKRAFILEARQQCHRLGVRFGAGDTEFIPWSDGDGCCGSSTECLPNSTQFRANFVGALSKHSVRAKKK